MHNDLDVNLLKLMNDFYNCFYGSKEENTIGCIKKVIFNGPATIVFWKDDTKTVVKCGENEEFDEEKGLAMAISKRALGNKGSYYEVFKKWLPKDYTNKKEES